MSSDCHLCSQRKRTERWKEEGDTKISRPGVRMPAEVHHPGACVRVSARVRGVCTCLLALACFYDLPRHFEPRPLRPRHFSIEAHFSQGETYRSSRACSSMVDARTCVTHSHVTVQSASVTWESPATPLPCPCPPSQDGRGSDSLRRG